MTTVTVADQVERVLKPIQQFVRGWMTGPLADRLAIDLGMQSGADLWIVGRAGVLGDGDADVAAAGLAFLAERTRTFERVRPGCSPAGRSAIHLHRCSSIPYRHRHLTRIGKVYHWLLYPRRGQTDRRNSFGHRGCHRRRD